MKSCEVIADGVGGAEPKSSYQQNARNETVHSSAGLAPPERTATNPGARRPPPINSEHEAYQWPCLDSVRLSQVYPLASDFPIELQPTMNEPYTARSAKLPVKSKKTV